jgi:RNA polymerase sigma factor (TIGR02999 family)
MFRSAIGVLGACNRGGFCVPSKFVSEVTRILGSIAQGDPRAVEELLPLVYEELRKLAAHKMAAEAPGQTLQPTALVHEAWLRLSGSEANRFENRTHFFAAAAQAMRRILIDNARRKRRQRHGGGWERVDLEDVQLAVPLRSGDLLALDEALTRLAESDTQAAELVQLRFFAGLSQQKVADVLGISRRTADRTWAYARAWLFEAIAGEGKAPE